MMAEFELEGRQNGANVGFKQDTEASEFAKIDQN